MSDTSSFDIGEDPDISRFFSSHGYCIVPVENPENLDRIQGLIVDAAARFLDVERPRDATAFLDDVHKTVGLDKLNDLRLAVIDAIRGADWFRPAYFSLARNTLMTLVGNELAMQRGMGLSVQLPDDDSSLLPIHADVWDGDSSFELVQWLPLVDCRATKSMYILPLNEDRVVQDRLGDFQGQTPEDLFKAVENDVVFLEVPYGSVLLFSQTLMHGNVVNRETTTRWSMNCRFKSAFSPYADKKLGEFFEPITLRPVTRLALQYRMPRGFDE